MSKLRNFSSVDTSLHRICVPTSDAIDRSIGEGIDEILNMRRGECSENFKVYAFNSYET